MTRDQFRRMALSFPHAIEGQHMDHPDFRVEGRIFATLSYPDEKWGMVKLTPEQQGEFVREQPGMFAPVMGAWGCRGATSVRLRAARRAPLRRALAAAWCNVAPTQLAQEFEAQFE